MARRWTWTLVGALASVPAWAEEETEPAAEAASADADADAGTDVPVFDHGTGHNLFGGRMGAQGDIQLYLSAGYADTEVGAHIGLGLLEVTPRVRFSFPGGGFSFNIGTLTLSPGVDLRWQVVDNGPLSGAVVFSVPVHVGFTPNTAPLVGVGLGHPGFLVTYTIADILDLDFGVQLQDDLIFAPGNLTALIGVPLIVGVEGQVIDRLQVGFRFEGGPSFSVGGGGFGGVGGRIRSVVAVGYTF